MKIKAILASLVGAVAISGATAGEWCPPAPDKCPVEECCPDLGATISVGYMSDYIFYGARLARDSVWADVSYTFDGLPLPVTVGVWYLSSFNPDGNQIAGAAGPYGDEADFYMTVGLPSMAGIDASFGYTAYTLPTQTFGVDSSSQHEIHLALSKEIYCGVSAFYRAAYNFTNRNRAQGAWVHKAGLAYNMDINDCIGLGLSGGVYYTDNYYFSQFSPGTDTGWNNYFLRAELPIALNCRTRLTPYIGYSGTPDTWVLDGSNAGLGAGGPNWGQNSNDVFHYGFSFSVDF